jgi:ParB family transcriptional regulator, chromosome partitioning protein
VDGGMSVGTGQAIQQIAVRDIVTLNPRARNRKIFAELVTSIAHLGLKKPITVSPRSAGDGYNLVCGQGRLEAFIELGQSHIPAVVVDATQEDCFVMSLVENLARRQHSPLELMREIGSLRERHYTVTQIATKTDFSVEYVSAICFLLDHGEERLLTAVDRGLVPTGIALEIARASEAEVQKALADAYESKTLPGNQVLAVRRIIDKRNALGKRQAHGPSATPPRKRVTADALVRAYRKEIDRQKLLVKKASLAQSRLLFLVNALRRLLTDDHFVTLLRAEAIVTVPKPLAERVGMRGGA